MKTEYQSKPWPIRVYRWCRFMPLAAIEAGVELIGWALEGCPIRHRGLLRHRFPWGRRQEARIIWNSHICIAHTRMGNYVLFSDHIAELRKKL